MEEFPGTALIGTFGCLSIFLIVAIATTGRGCGHRTGNVDIGQCRWGSISRQGRKVLGIPLNHQLRHDTNLVKCCDSLDSFVNECFVWFLPLCEERCVIPYDKVTVSRFTNCKLGLDLTEICMVTFQLQRV